MFPIPEKAIHRKKYKHIENIKKKSTSIFPTRGRRKGTPGGASLPQIICAAMTGSWRREERSNLKRTTEACLILLWTRLHRAPLRSLRSLMTCTMIPS